MHKILIVDDNVFFRQIVKEVLHARFLSIEITEVDDGEEALKVIPTFLPDLIFMDIRLHGENGLELTKKVKAQYPEINIVILTSYDLPEYRDAAYRCKANHYIPKDSFLGLVNSVLSDEE